MIDLPPDLIAAFVFFGTIALGSLALATFPDADTPLFEDNDHE